MIAPSPAYDAQMVGGYRQALDALLSQEYEHIPDTVYHYTSYEGLCGILRERAFWMTDYAYLNDPSEIRRGRDVLKEIIAGKNMTALSRIQSIFWEQFGEFLISDEVTEWFDFYIASFCRSPNYLPAWRWYGDNGGGFSLGISREYFHTLLSGASNAKTLPLTLGQVRYHKQDLEELIDRKFAITNRYLEQHSRALTAEREGETLQEISAYLSSRIVAQMTCVKHEGYKEEEEFRIVAVIPREQRERYPIGWRDGAASKFIDSRPYTFSPPLRRPDVRAIWVGPCCNFAHARHDLGKLLKEEGYKTVELFKSEIPYRRQV